MVTVAQERRMRSKPLWILMTVLAIPVSLYALANGFLPGVRNEFVTRLFADKPIGSLSHLPVGAVALAAGAFQFNARLRTRRVDVHRLLGKIYLGAVLVSGASAGYLALHSAGGVTTQWGFGLMAVVWVGAAALAFVRIRTGDVDGHEAWMMRSYAVCLGAVTLRVYLGTSAAMGIPFDQAYPVISWLCWVPNLLVVEGMLAFRRRRISASLAAAD